VREELTVVASVGTYHHPFDRFVDWLEPWTAAHDVDLTFQHGATRPIEGADNRTMMTPGDLLERYRDADVVVLQGGAGGVMDARRAGRIPIVVPRVPVDQEVVDDHQVVLSRRLAELGLVHVAETREQLHRLLDEVAAGTLPTRTGELEPTEGVVEAVRLLSELPEARRDVEGRTRLGLPRGTRVPAGEEFLAAREQVRRRGPFRVLGDAVRQGLLGYALTLLVTVVLARQLALPVEASRGLTALVLAWLVYSWLAQTAADRATALKPVTRFVTVVGVGLVGALLAGVENTPELRAALAVALGAAGTFLGYGLVHRATLRRTPTVLVGEERRVRRIGERWRDRHDVDVVASCVWRGEAESVPLGSPGSLSRIVPDVLATVARSRARSVVIASDHALTTPALRHLAWALQRADVECLVLADMEDHVEYLRPRMVADQLALTMRPPNEHLVSVAVKAVFDRVAALVALVVLSPVLLAIALAVRLTSSGPVIFRQQRTGRDGKPFTMLKFRTMVVDAEERLADLVVRNEGSGPLFKLGDDPRVTRVGRVLRRTSLDELPQLVNVLLGHMSIVGPRPALPRETAQYSQWVWRRLHVRPGLTGLWQVSGRSQLSWEESIRLDLQYVNTWSLRLDAAILLRTVRAVLTRDGAL
jgi:exopolysaccharide biosynthesis polyprenyl glycosylphosphotransferase